MVNADNKDDGLAILIRFLQIGIHNQFVARIALCYTLGQFSGKCVKVSYVSYRHKFPSNSGVCTTMIIDAFLV